MSGGAGRLSLIRHGEIHRRWHNHCYGSADVGLSTRGRAQSRRLAAELQDEPIDALFSSDLRRARYLAERLAESRPGLEVRLTPLLRERNFGAWEKRPWDSIYAEVGAEMEGMTRHPDTWRPPGGETTFELRDRVLRLYRGLPSRGHVVLVCHGGPIAALRGSLAGLPVEAWGRKAPALATRVVLEEAGG
ncbi:MAG: histidine phosphatase family protein [Acidobacteriota bacterium]